MKRVTQPKQVIAEIKLEACPEGPILEPQGPFDHPSRRGFAGWECPFGAWGLFRQPSGMKLVSDGDRPVVEWTLEHRDRALVTERADIRDGVVTAMVKPIAVAAPPHTDRTDCHEALAGIVFRWQTSRHYYQFGIEGRRRAVLYRRADDEWQVLAEQAVTVPDDYLQLEVKLDGDGLNCVCQALNVDFFCTDTTWIDGKAGFRAIGACRIASLEIRQTASQQARDERRHVARRTLEEELARATPAAVLVRTLDLTRPGNVPLFNDFAKEGQWDMLVVGDRLRALAADGALLWETPIKLLDETILFSKDTTAHGRLIFGLTGERVVDDTTRGVSGAPIRRVVADELCAIRGDTGEIIARAKIPPLDVAVSYVHFSPTTGNLSGAGSFDVVLREVRRDASDGGCNLWAYDRNLNLRWQKRLPGAPYGHETALQFYDVDGDGRDELLAGGTLFDANGNVLWVQAREPEMATIAGAGHYDAVVIGRLADDAAVDPVCFLLCGSAGVYVVDALTGRTRAVHRVGHAQSYARGRFREDLPGEQILVGTRWGNMGIQSRFSGHGDRLWTIQPDYAAPGYAVPWGERILIWMCWSGGCQSLYDGFGRRVKCLSAIRDAWGIRPLGEVRPLPIRLGAPPIDYLGLTIGAKLFLFGPEK